MRKSSIMMIILFLSSIFMIGCSDSNNESEQGNTGENSVNNIENNGPNNESNEKGLSQFLN